MSRGGRVQVDIHSHLVPGVDDGARDLAEALAAIDRLVAAGVGAILTTPHLDASLLGRRGFFDRSHGYVEAAWAEVVEACRRRHPGLALHLGREILLDVAAPDLRDPRVRLNGGPWVLVEFPRLEIPARLGERVHPLCTDGRRPILAHVERYRFAGPPLEALSPARSAGAAFQLNAGSIVGVYGPAAEAAAWMLLEAGWIDLAASDDHARGVCRLGEARRRLEEQGGALQAELLFAANPGRVVAGLPLEPVPPLAAGHRPAGSG